MHFEIATLASQGARRAQEDIALVWPLPTGVASTTTAALPAGLEGHAVAVMCDGMGGHAGGSLASRLASEAFMLDVIADHAETGDVRDRLFRALEISNAALADHIKDDPAVAGMGSTLVGVHLDDTGLHWISVGDSLLFLWRAGHMLQLNADHSLAPEIDKLAESGKITWEAAHNDPRRHYLRSALTGEEIEMIDLSEQAALLEPGDVVILASDGIHTLDADTICGIIGSSQQTSADAVAAELIRTVDAAEQPHQDNTTVVAIRVCEQAAD